MAITTAPKSEILDLLIVGAGIYGICAANTYLQLHPESNIKVLDSDSDAGGVWSTSRLYPQFWSQTGIRLAGFPDVPFKVPEDAETYHDLFEARHLAKYLEDYLTEQFYDGTNLRERFVFRCYVTSVLKDEDGIWRIKAKLGEERKEVDIHYSARKVIIATGLSSLPNMPELPGKDSFNGLILHQKDFGRSRILTADEPNKEKHTHITILGGSKSAADIAYAAATDTNAPRKVSWIIRKSGTGPLSFVNAKGFGKYKSLPETGSTRAMASLSPANPYLPESWWSWFLNKTIVGDWFLEKIWRRTEIESAKAADFHGREGRLPGFEGLTSESNIRWRTGPVGLLQKENFWDVVARNVQVYRQDLEKLNEEAVILQNGTEVKTDVLLCGTGWTQEHPYFSPEESARLGLPIKFEHEELVRQDREHWSKLEEEADRRVLERWPQVAHIPKFKTHPIETTPYKLYNMTIPIHDNSIAFLGYMLVPNSYHTSIVQALYAIAALDGRVEFPSEQEMERNVAFINRWCTRRYPAHGFLGNVIEYEMLSFTDQLLDQLGLTSHRSRESWWKDMTDPTLASDYAGLVDEYHRKYVVPEHA